MPIKKLADIVKNQAAKNPEKFALISAESGEKSSFADLDSKSNQTAHALLKYGISHESRVAILAKNTFDHFAILMGANRVGAVIVGINWRLAAPEIEHIIEHSETEILFVSDEFAPMVDKISLPGSCRVVLLDSTKSGVETFSGWIQGHSSVEPEVDTKLSDTCLHFYSSGTTGAPKGIELSNANILHLITEGISPMEMNSEHIQLICGPLFHIGASGMALYGLCVGATIILMKEVDLDVMMEAIVRYRITHPCLVPALIRMLLNREDIVDADVSSVEVIGYGASPIAATDLSEAIDVFGCKFVQAYGLTECTGGATLLLQDDHDTHPERVHLLKSCGAAMPGHEIGIFDPETGILLNDGTVGEIWVRGPHVMKGYWKNPDETAKVLRNDGWLRSGDAGFKKDGYLYISDRIKDMIISGGENVYPVEVENALIEHPSVKDVAVIGVPHEKWGETVKAIVVTDGEFTDEQMLIDFCRERIARYKCPTSVDWVKGIPRNASGKILKKDLRQQYSPTLN